MPTNTTDAPLLTTDEAAARLAVSRNTVRRMIARGDLAVVRLGRSVRIQPRHVDALIRASTSGRPQSRNRVSAHRRGGDSGDATP